MYWRGWQCVSELPRPRQDYTLYFDHFRIESSTDRFKRIAYVLGRSGLDTDKVVIEEGKVNLGLDGSLRFEQFMDLCRDLDFPMPVIMLSDSGQGVAGRAGEYGSPEQDAAYKAFWQAVQVTCTERGWPELIVQPVDEPGWQSQEHKDRNVYYLKLLKQIPGMRTEVDGPGDTYFHEAAGPYADVWNYNGAVRLLISWRNIRKSTSLRFTTTTFRATGPKCNAT